MRFVTSMDINMKDYTNRKIPRRSRYGIVVIVDI